MKKLFSQISAVILLSAAACSGPAEHEAEPPPGPLPTVAPARPAGAAIPTPVAALPRGTAAPYRVGPGDRLEVKVFKHDDLSGIFDVLTDGTIRFPLIGSIKVGELTVSEISEKLESALEEKYLVEAQINLSVKDYLSKPVNVLGSVQRPGKYYLKADTTLMDILTEAGGFAENAGDVLVVTRRSVDRRSGSRSWTLSIDEILKGQNPDLDIILAEGDTINVAEVTLFYVSGEVAKPGSYKLQRGMTLLKAISEAGGLGKFASKRGVEVHRKSEGKEAILRFNLGKIESQDEPDPELRPGDVVIVTRRFF